MKNILFIFLYFPILLYAQDNLLAEIDRDTINDQEAQAVFKGLKIVNFESTKLIYKKQ